MKLITANMLGQEKFDISADTTVFLAGPITFAPNWQLEFFKGLKEYQEKHPTLGTRDITVYSPRWVEKNELAPEGPIWGELDESPFDMRKQYDWESYHLRACDIIVFGFVPYVEEPKLDRSYARTTRIELGEAIGRNFALKEYQEDMPYNQDILVYLDENYTDDKDGYIKLKVSQNGFIWSNNWEQIYLTILNKTKKNVEQFNELKLQVRGTDAYQYGDRYVTGEYQ